MGGVVVDVDTRTEVPGLFVAGEYAGGAHGSIVLGGNGVANSTVYGGVAERNVMEPGSNKNGRASSAPDRGVFWSKKS